ncbi:MAG TPA: RNA polymerase sigma factor [Fimbriimonadaceae bacterium]|nr:RNA polymerase sigma factor [Fimbriimonadaceae bacterium]
MQDGVKRDGKALPLPGKTMMGHQAFVAWLMRDEAKRDKAAFEVLLNPVWGQLLAYCRRLAGDDAHEDLYQETLTLAFHNFGKYKATGSFISWLRRIALRIFLAWKRRKGLPTRGKIDIEAVWIRDDVDSVLSVERSLYSLRPEEREVVLLVAIEELTHAEAAEAIGVSVGTIRNRLARAAAKLRKVISRSPRGSGATGQEAGDLRIRCGKGGERIVPSAR